MNELENAFLKYHEFKNNSSKNHERFIFPYLCGTYFTYRKIDVMRVVAIAKSISSHPKYLDVGCGYGDFLARIREFIPDATGIEKDTNIFYTFNKIKPDHISTIDVSWGEEKFDVVFVGWMDPGVDYRRHVANCTKCIITTFDTGGQCGLNGACEYEDLGFHRVAWWRTPAWIDVNYEIMNKYYTKMTKDVYERLHKLRGAHNLWYVYAKKEIASVINNGLKSWIKNEIKLLNDKFEFESILDDCGFGYNEEIPILVSKEKVLWKVIFDDE